MNPLKQLSAMVQARQKGYGRQIGTFGVQMPKDESAKAMRSPTTGNRVDERPGPRERALDRQRKAHEDGRF